MEQYEDYEEEGTELKPMRCLRCNHRTFRMVSFLAKLFSHPVLRCLLPTMRINVPICESCGRIKELPVMDVIGGEVLAWEPIDQVIVPNTEVIYT